MPSGSPKYERAAVLRWLERYLTEGSPRLQRFATSAGTPIDLHRFRGRQWTPALAAAGIAHRSPYAMRHTFATWSIAAGLPAFEIARTMGTSLEQLDRTYGHLMPDSAERARLAMDAFITGFDEAEEAAR